MLDFSLGGFHDQPDCKWIVSRPVWHGVSKGVEDCRFGGGPPIGHRRVEHGGPELNFRESVDAPCHTGLLPRQPHATGTFRVTLYNVRNYYY
jgi:hypothetical protein